jgi:hypothetical protein
MMMRCAVFRLATTVLAGACALTASAAPARADDKADCAAAYTSGQAQRDSGAFTRARESLALCARPVCKDWMVAECARWLDDVERRQPTVVLFADGAHGELVDIVRVDLDDGKPFAKELDGRAIALDPGRHTLSFVARDGTTVSVTKMIAEGQKAMAIKATFETTAVAPTTTTPPPVDASSSAEPSSGGWRTAGWIMGGVGVAGLAAGGIFGLVALNKKSNGHCDASNVCDAGTSSGMKSAALLSDVGFVAGSVLLAGGAAILLFGPGKPAARTGLNVSPIVAASGGGVVLGGHFQ